MKDRIPLSRSVAIGADIAATAFVPDYIYLHGKGLRFHLEPSSIRPIQLVYPGPGASNSPGQIVMTQALENRWKSLLADSFALIVNHLENP